MKDALGHGSNAHNSGIEKVPRVPKPLAEIPRATLIKRIESEQARGSKITTELINMGHGMVKGQDILKMTGHPVFDHYRDNSAKLRDLYAEKEARMRYQGNEHPIKKSKWL